MCKFGTTTAEVVNLYRPPHKTTKQDYLADLERLIDSTQTLAQASATRNGILIVGDFNVPNYSSMRPAIDNDFASLFTRKELTQKVTGSTHCNGNLLDLVLIDTTTLPTLLKVRVNHMQMSDHEFVKLSLLF
jgi:endonuclease/exonuclease/phosphatase family metal-dependent hydrolase